MDESEKLRKKGERVDMTHEQVMEYIRCKNDVYYFLKNYFYMNHPDRGEILFDPLPFQYEVIDSLTKRNGDKRLYTIALAPRQSGKTTVATGVILHKIIFSEEKKPFRGMLLSRAQDGSIDILSRIKFALVRLPKWLQPEVQKYNETRIDFGDDGWVVAKATSENCTRGYSPNFIFWDEVSFVPRRIADAFIKASMPAIYRGEDNQMLWTSTPSGLDHFYDVWTKALKEENDFTPIRVDWRTIPYEKVWDLEAQERFKAKIIRTYGKQYFATEYENAFIGSSSTLINPEVLETLEVRDPIELKWEERFHIWEYPIPIGKMPKRCCYVLGVDTAMGVGKDSSVIQVLKIWQDEKTGRLKYKQVAVFRSSTTTVEDFTEVVLEIGKFYNNSLMMIENNDIGGNVASVLWYKYEYENIINLDSKGIGVRSSNKIKVDACMHMKSIIDAGDLEFHHKETIRELSMFEEVRTNVYKAKAGGHDDSVTSLMWGLYITKTEEFQEYGFELSDVKSEGSKYSLESAYNPETDDYF